MSNLLSPTWTHTGDFQKLFWFLLTSVLKTEAKLCSLDKKRLNAYELIVQSETKNHFRKDKLRVFIFLSIFLKWHKILMLMSHESCGKVRDSIATSRSFPIFTIVVHQIRMWNVLKIKFRCALKDIMLTLRNQVLCL